MTEPDYTALLKQSLEATKNQEEVRPVLLCGSCGIPLSEERRHEALATGHGICFCCLEMERSVRFHPWFQWCETEERAELEEAKIRKRFLMNSDADESGESTL